MRKINKYTLFLGIIFILIGMSFLLTNSVVNDDIYVVSESEKNNMQKITDNNEYKNKDTIKTEIKKESIKSEENSSINDIKTIRIFISGEVNNPGVVTIENNKRLIDAIDMLGGFTKDADLNQINLAMGIEDEKHYIIPKIGEIVDSNGQNTSVEKDIETNNPSSNKGEIDINIASIDELDDLPGIGEATANKIINYREEKGKFNAIEEIKNVNGIGDKKYEEIKDLIIVK